LDDARRFSIIHEEDTDAGEIEDEKQVNNDELSMMNYQ
jgi:hypothetical protein